MLLPGRSGRALRRHVRQAVRRARQTSERNSRSVYFLGVFFVLVVFMLLAEVVYVDPYSTVTTFGSAQPKEASWLYNIVPGLSNNFERVEEVHLEMDEADMHKLDKLYSEARIDHWQRIANTADKFFVFSAFMDRRRNVIKYVRVIAVARTRLADRVKCVFWSANRTSVVATVLASNRLIRENWNLKYSAFFLLCPIPSNSGLPKDYTPHAISLQCVREPVNLFPSNIVIVHDNEHEFYDFHESHQQRQTDTGGLTQASGAFSHGHVGNTIARMMMTTTRTPPGGAGASIGGAAAAVGAASSLVAFATAPGGGRSKNAARGRDVAHAGRSHAGVRHAKDGDGGYEQLAASPRSPPSKAVAGAGAATTGASSATGRTLMAVCVKPIHYEYDQVSRFAEFVEMHRLLGYSHFFFYNHTIGPHVATLVNHYVRQGVATVLPWKLDLVSQKEIRTEGLFAALNDCLYRSMYRFQYTAMVDFDEVIVPKLRPNATVIDLLAALNGPNPTRYGAFSFQNAFFYLQYPDEEVPFPDPARELLYLRKTRRKGKLHNHRVRSKYIVMPERVQEVGNHFVWEFMPDYHMLNVNPSASFLHHYRICEFGGDSCTINSSSVVDKTLHAYAERLMDAYARAMAIVYPANYSRYLTMMSEQT